MGFGYAAGRNRTPAPRRPGERTFLDAITGHRLYVLGALSVVNANALWALGIIDTAAFSLALVTIGAFIGGNTMADAVRDKANKPRTPGPETEIHVDDAHVTVEPEQSP